MSDHHRQIRVVDVFTERPLSGNQLGVVLDGRGLSTELMQRIAREMNFSETTFIFPPDDPTNAARLRIFTPGRELPFAGHPTIGTAWVMHAEGLVGSPEFTLEEGVGPVKVRAVEDVFWMAHPALTFGDVFAHKQVAAAIGIEEADIVHDIPAQVASTGNRFLFVALRDMAAVDRATSDPRKTLKLLRRNRDVGVFLFCRAGSAKLYGRMFATDTAEDPATGSAAGPLGGFAVRYGLLEREPMMSILLEQGTKMGRQSFVHIELTYVEDDDLPSRIEVGGSVRPVLRGTLSDFAD